jgi:hypothetical protein
MWILLASMVVGDGVEQFAYKAHTEAQCEQMMLTYKAMNVMFHPVTKCIFDETSKKEQ